MEFKDILEKLSDNSEMVNFVNSLNDKAQNVEGLTSKVNDLERKSSEAVESRQTLKSLIRNTLGVEDISEDSLKALLDNKAKPDEKSQLEIDNLKKMIESLNTDKTQIQNDSNKVIQDLHLTNSIRDLGIGGMASTKIAEQQLVEILKSGVTIENGKAVYKNEDGTTQYYANGVEMNTNHKLDSIKANVDYAHLFKPTGKSGSDTSGQDGNFSSKSNMGGTKEERTKAIQDRIDKR